LPNQLVCFAHSPSVDEIRRRGAQGGANKSTERRLARMGHGSLAPVLTTLYETLDGLKTGAVEPRQGAAIASVAGAIVKCREAGQLELQLTETLRRLDALERGRPA
jgi:hypothetical protein